MKTDKLDKLFSRYVRLKAGGYCKKCGHFLGYTGLVCAHFFGRLRHTVRWDERNATALCGGCHYEIDYNCLAKRELMLTLMSPEEVASLERIANMTIKEYPIDKEAIEVYLKEGIRRLENGREIQ